MLTVINRSKLKQLGRPFVSTVQNEGRKLLDYLAKEDGRPWQEINVLLSSETQIKKLNQDFRHHDQVTDVLTFGDPTEDYVRGDIALCLTEVIKKENDYQLSRSFLFYDTLLHGFLHLYGLEHDHRTDSLQKVHEQQRNILNRIRPNQTLIDEILKKIIL